MQDTKAASIRVHAIQQPIATVAVAAIDPAKQGLAVELAVWPLQQPARHIAVRVVVVRAGKKCVQQTERAARRDRKYGSARGTRSAFPRILSDAVEGSPRALNQTIGPSPVRTSSIPLKCAARAGEGVNRSGLLTRCVRGAG